MAAMNDVLFIFGDDMDAILDAIESDQKAPTKTRNAKRNAKRNITAERNSEILKYGTKLLKAKRNY